MKLIKDLGMKLPKETSKQKKRYGLYACPICEKHFETQTGNIKSGRTTKCKSCACTISNTIHGEAGTRLYKEWCGMKQRCYNPNEDGYKNYGGRGIKMCKEWRGDYITFRDWLYRMVTLTISRLTVKTQTETMNLIIVDMLQGRYKTETQGGYALTISQGIGV